GHLADGPELVGLRVEGRLEALEAQAEVEDVDVGHAVRRSRGCGERCEHARAAQRGLAQEAGARLALEDRYRLQQRLVAVQLLQRQGHGRYPFVRRSLRTSSGLRAGSAGRGAGRAPARSRIQAAWRASTATMPAASATRGRVRLAP